VKLNSQDYTRVPEGRGSILCDPCGEIVTGAGRAPGGGIYQRVKINLIASNSVGPQGRQGEFIKRVKVNLDLRSVGCHILFN